MEIALFSMYSITKLAIVALTGDPMAQPNVFQCFAHMFPEAKGQTFSLAVQRCCLQGRLR